MEDYKQKYEEAKFRMNKWVEGSEIIDPKEVAEFVFPELKESEDEKIRKELIEKVKETPACIGFINKNAVIAWLEKQGEQKPTEDNCKISDCIEKVDMTEYNKGYECGKQRVLKYPEDYGLCKKLAWGEEDERILKSIIINIENLQFSSDMQEKYHDIPNTSKNYYQIMVEWLKSLKERMKGE